MTSKNAPATNYFGKDKPEKEKDEEEREKDKNGDLAMIKKSIDKQDKIIEGLQDNQKVVAESIRPLELQELLTPPPLPSNGDTSSSKNLLPKVVEAKTNGFYDLFSKGKFDVVKYWLVSIRRK